MQNADQAKSLQFVLVGHDVDWCLALVYFRLLNYDPCPHDRIANLLNSSNIQTSQQKRVREYHKLLTRISSSISLRDRDIKD